MRLAATSWASVTRSASPSWATPWSSSLPRVRRRSTKARSRRVGEWVLERGGTLAPEDLAAYEPIVREPVRAIPRARSHHQPAAVIGRNPDRVRARALRAPGLRGVEETVAVMDAAQEARAEGFVTDLSGGLRAEFLDDGRLDRRRRERRRAAWARPRTSRRWTPRGAARASPARTAPARA